MEIAKGRWEEETRNHRYQVDEQDVAEVVAMITGVPTKRIAESEGNKLLNMSDDLKKFVVGQESAIEKLTRAIQRTRAGLKDPNKPIGSFIFLGPTGVGKTEMAKALAQYLFDSKEALLRIDMSEYMEKFAVSRLVGAPPGYVGYEEGGLLTEKVRRKPYSVILFDEIEKAHPDVFNLMLQVLDEGFLTDSLGRRVDFRNTVIIMTSNIGSRQLKDFGTGVGFSTTAKIGAFDKESKSVVENALKKFFSPEFLNRIDDVIIFNSLEQAHINEILDIQIDQLLDRISSAGFEIKLSKAAKTFLSEKGYDKDFGARPLKRAIQKYLEDPMAEEILKSKISSGDTVQVDLDKKNEVLKFKTTKLTKATKSQEEKKAPKEEEESKEK